MSRSLDQRLRKLEARHRAKVRPACCDQGFRSKRWRCKGDDYTRSTGGGRLVAEELQRLEARCEVLCNVNEQDLDEITCNYMQKERNEIGQKINLAQGFLSCLQAQSFDDCLIQIRLLGVYMDFVEDDAKQACHRLVYSIESFLSKHARPTDFYSSPNCNPFLTYEEALATLKKAA